MAEIDGYNTIIGKSDVEARIEEIEGSQGYDVVRNRNGEILETFHEEAEAEQYIEDEDFNPERVTVRRAELDEDEATELRGLKKLIEDVSVSSDWTLYNENYFDADWARDEARNQLPRGADFDSWPLSLIPWDEAAAEQRDALYPYEYTFDGVSFYGEE